MSYAAAAIRTAIAECMEGTIGSVRTVASGRFLRGVFEGQPRQAQKSIALQTSSARHRIDVRLGNLRNHPATSVPSLGNRRIAELDITILVTSAVATSNQASQRASDLAEIASDCDTAVQALSYPHNLTETSANVATGIIGGCLLGPNNTSVPAIEAAAEDWNAQTVRTIIRARAIVTDRFAALDGLSSTGVAALRYGHWVGGSLISSYMGPVGVVQRSDTDATSDFTTTAQMLAFASGTTGLLRTLYDQIGGNDITCSVKAAMATLCAAGTPSVLDDEGRLAYRLTAYNADYQSYIVGSTLDLAADATAMTVYHNAWDLADTYGMLAWAFSNGANPSGSGEWPAMAYSGSGAAKAVLLAYDDPVYPAYTHWVAPASPRWMRVVVPNSADTSDATYSYNGTALTNPTFDPDGPLSRTGATHFLYAADRPGALSASALLVFAGELSAADNAVVAAFFESIKAA